MEEIIAVIYRHIARNKKAYIFASVLYIAITLIFIGLWLNERRRDTMECGIVTEEFASMIINGTIAPLGFVPWYVALKSTNRRIPKCGGAIISREWVVTAHHCVVRAKFELLKVVAGSQNANEDTPGTIHQVIDIKTVESITKFPRRCDIALVRVYPRFKYRKHGHGNKRGIGPVCLPKPLEKITENEAIIAGFGIANLFHKIRPESLNVAKAQFYSMDDCTRFEYKSVFKKQFELQSVLCVGDEYSSQSGCTGDSGGPVTTLRRNAYTLVGIVSETWPSGCGKTSVLTNVASYREWIEESTGV